MAKVSIEQAAAILAIQQLINDWGYELDLENGANIADLVTADCRYHLGDLVREGVDAIVEHYRARRERLAATPEGIPVHRHILTVPRVSFAGEDSASITFSLIYFSTLGMVQGSDHADPAAVADVWMDVRREADGEWRIAMFNSRQSFRRVLG